MKKIDFAIHLFSAARVATEAATSRVPTISLLIMLEMSRRDPEAWHAGPSLAAALGIPCNRITTCCRGAVAAGFIQTRLGRRAPGAIGVDPLDWRVTPKGQQVVAQLLDTGSLTSPAPCLSSDH
jgi:hypothetical protein